MAALITNYGGQPIVRAGPPRGAARIQSGCLAFAEQLVAAVRHRRLPDRRRRPGAVRAVDREYPQQVLVDALSRTKVVVRGPSRSRFARVEGADLGGCAGAEHLARCHHRHRQKADERPIGGARMAVQEYGAPTRSLLDDLRARGAQVTPVPVYQWALPEDLETLKNAAAAIARGEVDVAIFTTSMQLVHLWQNCPRTRLEDAVRRELGRAWSPRSVRPRPANCSGTA